MEDGILGVCEVARIGDIQNIGERDKDPSGWRPQGIDNGLEEPTTETKDAANQRPA
jgi:hypothetical protein